MNIAAPASVLSKSQYALLKNVSPGRVTQWISEGKIEADALVGSGRSARIDVRRADDYLRRKLDISQRMGNGLSTRLNLVPDPVKSIPVAPVESLVPVSPDDPIEEQIKREKLEGLQRENRKRAEEEAARAGRYVDRLLTQAQMARIADQTLNIIEGGLPEIAATAAAKFNVPARDMLHLLRHEVRGIRSRAATSLKEQELALPEFIEAELETPVDEVTE